MHRNTRVRVLAAAAALAACAAPSAAHATCYTSTPTTQSISDSAADGQSGLAPEITSVALDLNATCGLTLNPVIAGRPANLISGDAVGTYIDTDGNPATGEPVFNGADRVILVVGLTGPDLPPGLGVWDGTTFSFAGTPNLPLAGIAGASTTVDQLGITTSPLNLSVRTGAIWKSSSTGNVYGDFAPEPGANPFAWPVAFSSVAPLPPPPPAPVPVPVPAPAPAPAPVVTAPVVQPSTTSAASTKSCKVPSTKGLTSAKAVAKLKKAGCKAKVKSSRSSKVRRGRVISTVPAAGRSSTSGAVTVKVSAGKARASSSSTTDLAGVYAEINRQILAEAQ